jgi:hypothetical protein
VGGDGTASDVALRSCRIHGSVGTGNRTEHS